MTDGPRFQAQPPDALLRLELWSKPREVAARFKTAFGDPLPGVGRAASMGALRVIWREPGAWMIRAPRSECEAMRLRLQTLAGEDGAVTDISGAAVRCTLRGADWRILLTHGGVFDAEAPKFAPGCVAGTVVEHIAVRFDVVAQDQVDAYVSPSFAEDLFAYWATVAGDLDVWG